MGHTQSSEESPDTVRIDKTAVPDSFDVVHVSDGVVDRVGTARRRTAATGADGDAQKLQLVICIVLTYRNDTPLKLITLIQPLIFASGLAVYMLA